jgi:hypothetical protein
VTNNGSRVTGTSTSFTTAPAVAAGDILLIGTTHARINSVDSATQLTIEPWPGSTLGPVSYFILRQADLVDVFVEQNECWENDQDGINVDASALHNVIIADNICRNNEGYGIQSKLVYDGSEFRRLLLFGNRLFRNDAGGIQLQMNDLSPEPLMGNTVSINTSSSAYAVNADGTGVSFFDSVTVGRRVKIGAYSDVLQAAMIETDTKFYLSSAWPHGTISGARLSIYPELRGAFVIGNLIEHTAGSVGAAARL